MFENLEATLGDPGDGSKRANRKQFPFFHVSQECVSVLLIPKMRTDKMSVLLMGLLAWQVLSTWQYFQTFSLEWVHNEISRLAKKKKNDEIQKIETFRTFQLFNVPSTFLACSLNFSGKLCNRSYEASCSCVPSPFLKYRCMDPQIWQELCLYIPLLIT